jgi:uncharacterized protein YndB with AHSA1/START domain
MKTKAALFPVLLMLTGLMASAQSVRRRTPAAAASDIEVTRAATLRLTISSDPASIFEYLVDAQKLEAWCPDQAVSEAQLGGRYHFHWDDKPGVWSGRFTYFIRGNSVNYTWQAPDDEYETSVQFKLLPQGAGTLVELTHSGFPSNAAMDKTVKSWVFYLENLKSVIESGTDLREEQRHPPARKRPRKSGRNG